MKKLKYILASVVLATAFTSCETEAIDEKLKDETVAGKPILRFELNDKQTIVTDKVQVEKIESSNSYRIVAKVSVLNETAQDAGARYKVGKLKITYNTLELGNFPTFLTLDDPKNHLSNASLEIIEEGVYSTINAKEGQPTGYSNITFLNTLVNYMDGNFEYILYPPQGSSLQPQRLTKGKYAYVNY